jgi:GT2 family glycosyltransferase
VIDPYIDKINLKYIKNRLNKGPSFSRNVGIKLANNPYIAFTDNDCLVTKDWLLRLHEYIRDAPSNVAGVGGRTVALGNDIISKYYEYNKILDPWFYNGKWLYIVSANAIFKKKILEEVGGFDEDVKKAGGEDVGLCFKINNKGYDLLYNDDAIIIHDFEVSIKKLWKTFFNYGYGSRIQYDKYFVSTKNVKKIGYAGIH